MNQLLNEYEVYMDVEPLASRKKDGTPIYGEKFSINRDVDVDLRIEFKIEKDVRLDPNQGEIRVYNLTKKHQQALAYRYDIGGLNYGGKISLYAGYRGEAKRIFEGNVVRSYPEWNGGDVVTYIQVMHLVQELAGGVANRSFPKGTKPSNVIDYFFSLFSDTKLSPDDKARVDQKLSGLELKNGETYQGSALGELQKFSNRFEKKVKIFFDENGPHILGPGESNGDDPIKIDQFSGLMGSPTITDIGANIRMRLNPGIRNGTPIEVDSLAIQLLNNAPVSGVTKGKMGRYIAEKITHMGDNYPGGEWTTEVTGIYEGGAI